MHRCIQPPVPSAVVVDAKPPCSGIVVRSRLASVGDDEDASREMFIFIERYDHARSCIHATGAEVQTKRIGVRNVVCDGG